MNHLELTAQVIERSALRYTPAGLPALDLRLSHASNVGHVGSSRQIALEVHATAIGDEARKLERTPIGASAVFQGFLARQRNGRGVMMQIQSFELLSTPQI